MRLVAGVDVGNATTEVVLVAVDTGEPGEPEPVAWDSVPTRGGKGSSSSLAGAVALVRRLELRTGRRADAGVVAPLRPVRTTTVTLDAAPPATGRLRVLAAGRTTPGLDGLDAWGCGRPVPIGAAARHVADDRWIGTSEPLVLLVPRHVGFTHAAAEIARLVAASAPIVAVLVAGDEGALIANRTRGLGLPIVDEIDVDAAATASRVAVEVRPTGEPLRLLTDAIRLLAELRLDPSEQPDATSVARRLDDVANAVVGVTDERQPPSSATGWLRVDGRSRDLPAGLAGARAAAPGAVDLLGLPGQPEQPADDVFGVDLADSAEAAWARAGSTSSRSCVLAVLHRFAPESRPDRTLADQLGIPFVLAESEATAAGAGALTTPGVSRVPTVVDLGGGTVDVVSGGASVVAAGCGELLTAATAAVLGVSRGTAEWAKRGPASRLAGPHVLEHEGGERTFLDVPARGDAVGSLVVRGPAGLLPFDRRRSPSEWRALRLRLKVDVIGANVQRATRVFGKVGPQVVVVGGPAGDDEVLSTLARALPGAAVGRADVAGRLGHRYAVAYGLTLLARHADRW